MIQERTSQVLHGLSALRHWLHARLPVVQALAGSEAGLSVVRQGRGAGPSLAADLFLELADHWAEGRPPTVEQLCQSLACSREHLVEQLRAMADAGLLAEGPPSTPLSTPLSTPPGVPGGGSPVLLCTPAFERLLAAYERELQTRFIPREPLRNEQLFIDCQDEALAAEVRLLYDHCFDLGWLYLHRFGATCFMMAIVLQALLAQRGYRAYVQIGELEVQHDQNLFVLGRQPQPTPGRIDAHACCVVDDRLVLDFGLGNVRRHHRRGFFWGMATDRLGQAPLLAETRLPDGGRVRWTCTGQAPDQAVQTEVQRCRQLLPVLVQAYAQRFATGDGGHP